MFTSKIEAFIICVAIPAVLIGLIGLLVSAAKVML